MNTRSKNTNPRKRPHDPSPSPDRTITASPSEKSEEAPVTTASTVAGRTEDSICGEATEGSNTAEKPQSSAVNGAPKDVTPAARKGYSFGARGTAAAMKQQTPITRKRKEASIPSFGRGQSLFAPDLMPAAAPSQVPRRHMGVSHAQAREGGLYAPRGIPRSASNQATEASLTSTNASAKLPPAARLPREISAHVETVRKETPERSMHLRLPGSNNKKPVASSKASEAKANLESSPNETEEVLTSAQRDVLNKLAFGDGHVEALRAFERIFLANKSKMSAYQQAICKDIAKYMYFNKATSTKHERHPIWQPCKNNTRDFDWIPWLALRLLYKDHQRDPNIAHRFNDCQPSSEIEQRFRGTDVDIWKDEWPDQWPKRPEGWPPTAFQKGTVEFEWAEYLMPENTAESGARRSRRRVKCKK